MLKGDLYSKTQKRGKIKTQLWEIIVLLFLKYSQFGKTFSPHASKRLKLQTGYGISKILDTRERKKY